MGFDGGAAALRPQARRPGSKMKGSAQELNPLPHRSQAIGLAGHAQLASNVEAPSVILDSQRHRLPPTRHRDFEAMGISMGDDIGKRPLKHLVQGCLATRGQLSLHPGGVKPNLDSGSLGELARVESNRWYKALLVPHRRAQIKSKMPDTLQGMLDQSHRFFQFPPELAGIGDFDQ